MCLFILNTIPTLDLEVSKVVKKISKIRNLFLSYKKKHPKLTDFIQLNITWKMLCTYYNYINIFIIHLTDRATKMLF